MTTKFSANVNGVHSGIDLSGEYAGVAHADLPLAAITSKFIFEQVDGTAKLSKTVTFPCRVIFAYGIKGAVNGGAGDLATLTSAAAATPGTPRAIGACDLHVNAGVLALAPSIDAAGATLAAGDILSCTAAHNTDAAATVFVEVIAL